MLLISYPIYSPKFCNDRREFEFKKKIDWLILDNFSKLKDNLINLNAKYIHVYMQYI